MAPELSSPSSKTHVVLFPFMSKGHTIPLLHLARLLLPRGAAIIIFTTPASHPFISDHFLSGDDVSLIDLTFPDNVPGIPPGVESTDKLPSMDLFVPFVNALKLMQTSFEEALQNIHAHLHVSFIVSDGFLPWTLESAARLGVPRLSFYGMSHYAGAVSHETTSHGLLSLHESGDEPFTLPGFPSIKLTRNDFDDPFDKPDPRGPHLDFIIEVAAATANSFGLLVNSFYELEPTFADYWDRECKPRAWTIGPLCLAAPPPPEVELRPRWIQWLDQKLAQGCSVLYVAFGSQAKISPEQLREIADGLVAAAAEEAETRFLWVVRKGEAETVIDYIKVEEERGMIVNEWVDQRRILEHAAVKGFVSHCGWNSVLEAVCAGVPIVAWPMMAEQWLNARFLVEEIKVGLRVGTVDGSVKGFVKAERLKEAVVELMEGEKGKELRERVEELAAAARDAVAEGGSSWLALDNLVGEIQRHKEINNDDNVVLG